MTGSTPSDSATLGAMVGSTTFAIATTICAAVVTSTTSQAGTGCKAGIRCGFSGQNRSGARRPDERMVTVNPSDTSAFRPDCGHEVDLLTYHGGLHRISMNSLSPESLMAHSPAG